MAAVAKKTNPKLWESVKSRVTRGDKGGKPGQWSARKAQLAVAAYKHEGGGYEGKRREDNHLREWQREDWGTKSGRESGKTGERYLPRKARDALTDGEYARSTAKKRDDTRKGLQFSRQPKDVARKTAGARRAGGSRLESLTRAELVQRARARKLPGRSWMTKDQLAAALRAR